MSEASTYDEAWRAHHAALGHSEILEHMFRLVSTRQLPPVLLFHGARGVGQQVVMTEVARLAAGLTPPVAAGGVGLELAHHPDVWQMPDEDIYKKERAVAIQQHLEIYPARAAWRIVLIPHADRFHQHSVQLLLKILEEPPPQALVLMSTHRRHRLIPTLKSRLVACLVRPPSFDQFRAQLEQAWASQGGEALPRPWTAELFRLSGGSVAGAMDLLRQRVMLQELQQLLLYRGTVWELPQQVARFIEEYKLKSPELLEAIELCLTRIYNRHAAHGGGAPAQHRRTLLAKYHRAMARHDYVLQSHVLLQGCVSGSYLPASEHA